MTEPIHPVTEPIHPEKALRELDSPFVPIGHVRETACRGLAFMEQHPIPVNAISIASHAMRRFGHGITANELDAFLDAWVTEGDA